MWTAKWQALKKISADKEFITVESMKICEASGINVRQAVPYDHRRGLGTSEGLNRWLQDCAQAHMNRLTVYVKLGLMTEYDKRSLWFHALTYANDVKLLAPSKCDPSKTQFEEGEKVKFNFSTHVLLPFGLRVVIRKKTGDQDGRGIDGIYVGFSKVVAGGILVYTFASKRVVQKYTFIPREPLPQLSDIDCEYAALALYGDLQITSQTSESDQKVASNSVEQQSEARGDVVQDAEVEQHRASGGIKIEDRSEYDKEIEPGNSVKKKETKGDNQPQQKKNTASKVVNTHFTRSKKYQNIVLHVSAERPPMPKIPTRQEARTSERWRKAYKREIIKINEENVMVALPQDESGRFQRPDNAIVMRLLAVYEWKWKPDPDTKIEGWLECVRIVCDGSADKREGEVTYAETPDRTLMFLMASVEASLGIKSKVGDAVRAYLNAPSLDKNLLVIADKVMTSGQGNEGFCQESLLIKGLYGSIKGALSFQVWADMKLAEIGYAKCDVARGVYLKTVADDIVRLYRHSDDFRLSCSKDETMDAEIEAIQSKIRMTPFAKLKKFLGCDFER